MDSGIDVATCMEFRKKLEAEMAELRARYAELLDLNRRLAQKVMEFEDRKVKA